MKRLDQVICQDWALGPRPDPFLVHAKLPSILGHDKNQTYTFAFQFRKISQTRHNVPKRASNSEGYDERSKWQGSQLCLSRVNLRQYRKATYRIARATT
jgi:hypothetical protein